MDGFLFLVNRQYPLPDEYQPDLVPIPGYEGMYSNIGCVKDLVNMLDDCRAAGALPVIRSAYRSPELQKQILISEVALRLKNGLTGEEALEEAEKCCALPRRSEHETGLAVDIGDARPEEESKTIAWLGENCQRYGFILRYPDDKISVTGIIYEPWHFRYVGFPHAERITESGLCLEEYCAKYPQNNVIALDRCARRSTDHCKENAMTGASPQVQQNIHDEIPNCTNSPLVDYTRLSPNHSGLRLQAIDRITPHCAVAQCTVEELGGIFYSNRRLASSNYGIGTDGRIGMYVEEKNQSWCSSNGRNDRRAVTIECASEDTEPYEMNDAVYETLIRLCTDICKRNGKKKLLWFADKDKTLNYIPTNDEMVLTVHRWFDNKSCPGEWLYTRLGDLAEKVSVILTDCVPNTTENT